VKALTLRQPWATLVAIGAKQIETRSWAPSYRGRIAIHAAKGFSKEDRRLVIDKYDFYRPISDHFGVFAEELIDALPLGAIIAECRLVDCLPTQDMIVNPAYPSIFRKHPELDTPLERAYGNYNPGRWAWLLADVNLLPKPIPVLGMLGLWEWEGKS
jgi:hypothetical protein